MEDPRPHTFSPQTPTFKKHLTKAPILLHSLDSVEAAVARYHQEARGVSFGILRDAMAKRALCKFFARGACLKGEYCEFSHDWKPPPNNICNFYQKGVCAYGDHCRYEHVKVAQSHSSTPLSSDGEVVAPDETNESLYSPSTTTWSGNSGHHDVQDAEDQFICSFATGSDHPQGVNCPHIHGDICPIYGKHCLHPFMPEIRQKRLDALRCSQEIECGICLERVLSKSTSAERKFGILSECDHTFCISCIRNWRSSSPSSGLNVNSALRSCPMCRKLSYFVIPSVIWYSSKEEKQAITQSYKAKLRTIDCKHFDFGNGTCPFRTSCFYRHANCDDGSPEEVILRPLGAEDSNMVITKSTRLSDDRRS